MNMQKSLFIRFALGAMLALAVGATGCSSDGGGDGGDGGDGGGGDDGGGVPATTTWGVIVLIALFLGITLFYMRRRAKA